MLRYPWILLALVFTFQGGHTQTDERPTFTIPEPSKKTRQNTRQNTAFTITQLNYERADQNKDAFPNAIEKLVHFVQTHANKVEVDIRWNKLPASSPRIQEASLLYMTGQDAVVQFSEVEKKNLGQYLQAGGLLFGEDIRHSNTVTGQLIGVGAGVIGTPFDRQFKALIGDPLVLGNAGRKWLKVPKTHPLYSSYYDFDDGPPMGAAPGGNVHDLEMLQHRGRVVAVFSDLNLSWYWGDPLANAREPGLKWGVNLIVFTLAQRALGAPLPASR
jgi:hypothetical protein